MYKSALLFWLCLLFSIKLFAQSDAALEVFESPKRIEIVEPIYPTIEAREGEEGWVVVNYMVDTEGNVFEPTVIASTGSSRFEKAALKAIEESKFEPAKIGGAAVEGSDYLKFTFSLYKENRASGASRGFISRYKKLNEALESGDKETIEPLFRELNVRTKNHYERAYLDFARSLYFDKQGHKEEQLKHLRSALQYESYDDGGGEFLPIDLVQVARQQLFALEVENKQYENALKTYEIIKKKYGVEAAAPFKNVYQQLIDIKNNETVYAINSKLDESGYFSIRLHKRGFGIQNANTKINEFKLRCSKKYVFFAYEEGKQYKIPESWGSCSLQVLGAANGSFQLVQF